MKTLLLVSALLSIASYAGNGFKVHHDNYSNIEMAVDPDKKNKIILNKLSNLTKGEKKGKRPNVLFRDKVLKGLKINRHIQNWRHLEKNVLFINSYQLDEKTYLNKYKNKLPVKKLISLRSFTKEFYD